MTIGSQGGGYYAVALPVALVGTPATYTSGGTLVTHTLAYTVTSGGANRKLIVCVATEKSGGVTHASMTYNGTAMTLAITDATFANDRISIFYADEADLPSDDASHDIVHRPQIPAGHQPF